MERAWAYSGSKRVPSQDVQVVPGSSSLAGGDLAACFALAFRTPSFLEDPCARNACKYGDLIGMEKVV